MTLLAYPVMLGLPGAAVRFVAQDAAADDREHVAGFMKMSSWLAFGCGALIATLAIGALLLFNFHLDPDMSRRRSSRLPVFRSSLRPSSGRKQFGVSVGWRLHGDLFSRTTASPKGGQPPLDQKSSEPCLPRPTPRAASKPTLKPRRARGHAQAVRDLAEGVRCGVLSWRPWPALGSGGRPRSRSG